MDTVATADALGAVRCFNGIDAHLADARAFAAIAAFVVNLEAVETDGLQDSVKGAERTEVAAEDAIEKDGEREYGERQSHFPCK